MKYMGRDNLDIMHEAKLYNDYIFKWIQTDGKVLDFGAGNGEFCNRFGLGNIIAIEVDDILKETIKCPVYTSINDLKYNDFDLIYSLNVLEHIENDSDIVDDLKSLLKKGGIVKILVPARQEIYSSMDKKVGHFRRYERKALINMFENNGFKVVSCDYFDFLGYFIALLYKLVNNEGTISHSSIILYDKVVFPLSILFDKITFGKIIGKNLMLTAIKK